MAFRSGERGRGFLLTAVAAGMLVMVFCVGPARGAGVPERDVVYDAYGRVILDAEGQRINYDPDPTLELAPAGLEEPTPAAPPKLVEPKAGLTVSVEWIWAVYGVGIGDTGLKAVDLDGDGNLEVVAAASASGGFEANSYWYVLRHSDGDYPHVFTHLEYTSPIRSLRTYDLDGDGDAEVLVGTGSDIRVYDGLDPVEIRSIPTAATEIRGLQVADVDGDLALELVFCDAGSLFVYDYATGLLEEEVAGRGGNDVAVGQVDADGGLEIVVAGSTNGWVLDGASRALEWDNPAGFGVLVRAGDLDGDGRDEIAAGDEWYLVTVYDADLQTVAWTIAVDFNLSALQLIDVEGDGPLELVYGDAQWGEVHVYDGATGVEKWQKPNPGHGVTDVAVADVDGDGTRELLWGAGFTSSGADFLFVADAVTLDDEWQSVHLDSPHYGLDYGDVDADGLNELLHTVFESDSGYSDGMYLVHGAASHLEEYRSGELNPLSNLGVRRIVHAQVDGDPQQELFTATGGFNVWIVAYDGLTHAVEWQAAIEDGLDVLALQVADADGDGFEEVVVATGREHTGASGVYLYVFDAATGAPEWQSPSFGNGFVDYPYLRVRNVDGDANPEIVTAREGGEVRIFDGVTGAQQLSSGTGTTALATPDRDGDGVAEILVGTSTGTIKVIDAATGATLETIGNYGARINSLVAYELTGDAVDDYVFCVADQLLVADGAGGGLVFNSGDVGTGVGFFDSVLVADVDADGNPEIVVNLGGMGILVYGVSLGVFNPPVVTITAPGDGSSYFDGDTVSLAGTATDVEDGDLSAAILWSSSLDGPLGTGATLDVSTLSLGTHVLTAAVSDSDSLQGSDTTYVTIERVKLFQEGNILVSVDDYHEVREYTRAGVLAQVLNVPANGTEQQRDLFWDEEADVLHVFNGTFNPLLASYDGTWSANTFPGWSLVNGTYYGAVAATAGFVFATDMSTAGDGSPRGIVRFDTRAGYTAIRFAETYSYFDLTIGLDCKLYALRSGSGSTQLVDVFDPLTMASLGQAVLTQGGPSMSLRSVTVSASGEFFAVGDSTLYHFDSGGSFVKSLNPGGSSLLDVNLNGDGDVVVADWEGRIFLTTTALASASLVVDLPAYYVFVAFAGGEMSPGCPSCYGGWDLVAGQWKMISLPCDVGAADRVQDVFGDDLDLALYGTNWGLFERDELGGVYNLLAATDSLHVGEGYWIKTLDAGQTATVPGEPNPPVEVPLFADPVNGMQNMVGHPFDFDVCWADVEVVDGGSVLTLAEADPLIGPQRACDMVPPDPSCVVSRVARKWNGAAYDAFDGVTMGMQGTLRPLDGLWVEAFKPGTALRIPAQTGSGCTFCEPQPVVDAGADQVLCPGDTVTLGTPALAGHTYLWSPGGETTAQIDVSPAVSTTYTLEVTTICGSAQDSVSVVVDDGTGGLTDDFEGDVSGWTLSGAPSLWHLSDGTTCFSPVAGYSSATHAFYYGRPSPDCDYDTGDNWGTLTSPSITGVNVATNLTFQYLRQGETSTYWDKCEVRIVHPGGTDTVLQISSNATAAWTTAGPISLAAYAGQTIQVQLSFDSVGSTLNNYKGWLIDDVVVGSGVVCGAPLTLAEAPSKDRAAAKSVASDWMVRLVALSGDLYDPDNVLGQLADAGDGYDYHDLPELEPFDVRHLSIVFPHGDWQEQAGDYTSDFHAPWPPVSGEWPFEVVSAGLDAPVTLSWTSLGVPLTRMSLVDEATGVRIPATPGGSYVFMPAGARSSFRWVVELCDGDDASGDADLDGLCADLDNCPSVANPDQADADLDGTGDACDLCWGDDASGDADGDLTCADLDCNDADPAVRVGCTVDDALFADGFESGGVSAWSAAVGVP